MLQPGLIDDIARGMVSTPMESLDQFITGEVTNHLFEDRKIPFSGIDLIALNVQRARDHGKYLFVIDSRYIKECYTVRDNIKSGKVISSGKRNT